MPSYNDWGVEYPAIQFFENGLLSHSRVESFARSNDILFTIHLTDGRSLIALLVSEYTVGEAAVIRAISKFPSVNHIVTSGVWCSYTEQAKQYGFDHNVGVFVIDEFLGALNWEEPIKYQKPSKDNDAQNQHKIGT